MIRQVFLLLALWPLAVSAQDIPSSARSEAAALRVTPQLQRDFAAAGLSWGQPLFIQIFKREAALKLWVRTEAGTYQLFRTYQICTFSGDLGPKLKQGDRQAPEGFYKVAAGQLNPWSSYHLSFNLGYPNAYDRAHGRTGDYLMVHGDCVSIGCFAMGQRRTRWGLDRIRQQLSPDNQPIEEIYTLISTAFEGGQAKVPVHIFPFALTAENLAAEAGHKWHAFWSELQPAYLAFEERKIPPQIGVRDRKYVIAP